MFLSAGHEHHGIIAEALERFLEGSSLPEPVREIIEHTVLDFGQILLLLVAVVTLVSFLQTYIPYHKMQHKLQHLNGVGGYTLAVGLGLLSPFCSCTIIPVVMGFVAAGVPLPLVLCFLTTASVINLTSITSLSVMMPLSFTVIYVACGLVLAVGSSLIIQTLKIENPVIGAIKVHEHSHITSKQNTLTSRIRCAFSNTCHILSQVWLTLLIGVVLSATIMALADAELIAGLLTKSGILAFLLAVILGGVLHSDVYSTLPIIMLLYQFSPPLALTFLLSVMAISVAELVLLSKVFSQKLLGAYTGVLLGMSLIAGLVWLAVA